jgi:ATP-dependent DNA ligase
LKHDGFRALAFVEDGERRLVSRNGNTFRTLPALCEWIGQRLRVENALVDGEIVWRGRRRSVFNDLLFRRGDQYLYAFDSLARRARICGEKVRV